MYIFYSTEDLALSPTGQVHWYYAARLVECKQQRLGMSGTIRNIVKNYPDHMKDSDKKTVIKHYVPYCRISRQLIKNITYFDPKGSIRGMTREGTVDFLKRMLDEFKIDGKNYEGPLNEPWESRMAFDAWVSWAIGTLCDWPQNLFQGESWGDHQGVTLDVPKVDLTTPALQMRLGDAAKQLRYWIKDLNIEHDSKDPPAIPYEEYVPGEDEWFMP